MGIFALVRSSARRPAREVPTRTLGATLPLAERVVKGETHPKAISTEVEEAGGQEVRLDGKSLSV
ncbi:hypothetical protein SBA2_30074 [Acidobacteriia bacterium SbA2]|nr:hypothetical protein SBA2_30074 [Acidobacteriia bacterium SbA2]